MLTVRDEGSTGEAKARWPRRMANTINRPRALSRPPMLPREFDTMSETRIAASSLVTFASALAERSGVRADIARDVADVLVTGDLLGHTTHGLALLPPYLAEIEKGSMAKSGEPSIVNSRPAAQLWDGKRLPGPWLTLRAMDAAATMAATYGTGTVVIRRLSLIHISEPT